MTSLNSVRHVILAGAEPHSPCLHPLEQGAWALHTGPCLLPVHTCATGFVGVLLWNPPCWGHCELFAGCQHPNRRGRYPKVEKKLKRTTAWPCDRVCFSFWPTDLACAVGDTHGIWVANLLRFWLVLERMHLVAEGEREEPAGWQKNTLGTNRYSCVDTATSCTPRWKEIWKTPVVSGGKEE